MEPESRDTNDVVKTELTLPSHSCSVCSQSSLILSPAQMSTPIIPSGSETGVFPPWHFDRWRAVDDRVRGGSSVSHLEPAHSSVRTAELLDEKNDSGKAARFWGHLGRLQFVIPYAVVFSICGKSDLGRYLDARWGRLRVPDIHVWSHPTSPPSGKVRRSTSFRVCRSASEPIQPQVIHAGAEEYHPDETAQRAETASSA